MSALTESEVRARVVERLTGVHRGGPGDALLVEELGVGRGASRADVGLLTPDCLVGIEIKSAADSVARLPGQVRAYGRVFDRAVLVTDPSHLQAAGRILPPWWGVWTVDGGATVVVHEGAPNPTPDLAASASMLWMPELKAAVATVGLSGGTAGLERADLADVLVAAAPGQVRHLVREGLLARSWEDTADPDGHVRFVRQPTPTRARARRARRDNRRARRSGRA